MRAVLQASGSFRLGLPLGDLPSARCPHPQASSLLALWHRR